MIPTRISFTKEQFENQPGTTEFKMVYTRFVCSTKDIKGAVKLKVTWDPIIRLYSGKSEEPTKPAESPASEPIKNQEESTPIKYNSKNLSPKNNDSAQKEKRKALIENEVILDAAVSKPNEIREQLNMFFDGFSLILIDDMSHKDWSVPIIRIQTSSVNLFHTRYAIVPTNKIYLAINKAKLESYNANLGDWEPTIEEVTFFITKELEKPKFPEETDGKAEFVESIDFRFDEEVEYVIYPFSYCHIF